MINNKQKALAHIYADAAGLRDHEYRALLKGSAGVTSCADPKMTQSGFEHLMAALESTLFDRVEQGIARDPRGQNRYIISATYWRKKLPRDGMINSRQDRMIRDLWAKLIRYLPEDQRTTAYLAGIAAKATARADVGRSPLSNREAGLVINALKDRFAWEVRDANEKVC